MKTLKKTLTVTLILALLVMSCAAAESVTIVDMKDIEHTFDAPVTKIVALTAADCEILCALGCEDLLVGRGEYCDYPASVLDIPSVQSGYETNIEQIIALQPEVVLVNTMNQTIEQAQMLEAAGIAVITSEATDIDGVYSAIEVIGKLTGKNDEAAALIEEMQAAFAEVTKEDSGKTVYFEVSPLEWGLWAAGANTFMDEIAGILGLTNIFADVEGWAEVSEEQVLARDPDYIVTTAMYYGEGPTPVEEIMGRSGWEDIKAVKNEAVFNADSDEMTRPGPRLTNAAESFAEFIEDK